MWSDVPGEWGPFRPVKTSDPTTESLVMMSKAKLINLSPDYEMPLINVYNSALYLRKSYNNHVATFASAWIFSLHYLLEDIKTTVLCVSLMSQSGPK